MATKLELDRSRLLGFDRLGQDEFEALAPGEAPVPPSMSAKVGGKPAPSTAVPRAEGADSDERG